MPVTDLELGVADGVGGVAGHAHALGGAEHVEIEVDGRVGAATAQVGRDPRVTGGDGIDVGHGDLQGNGANERTFDQPTKRSGDAQGVTERRSRRRPQRVTEHERRVVGAEPEHRVGDLLGGADAADRVQRDQLRLEAG